MYCKTKQQVNTISLQEWYIRPIGTVIYLHFILNLLKIPISTKITKH